MAVEVMSYITGKVLRLDCEEGQALAKGELVATLESMKMEMPVEAPESGVVTKIHVAAGESILQGDVIATLN